ncbi:hypothetical protein GCM10009828_103530 [Actinoplanes couchii]
MDGAHLSVSLFPEPGDDRAAGEIHNLLLERGARPDGDHHFIERHRRMRLDRADDGVVEIVMSAGPFDYPDGTRQQMIVFGRYLVELLVAVTERTRPLYGGVGVERPLATPGKLRDGIPASAYISDPLFVRQDLLARADLETVLTGEFRRTIPGAAGTVFASWWPFADGKPSNPGGLSQYGSWAGGRILGRVAARHIAARARG